MPTSNSDQEEVRCKNLNVLLLPSVEVVRGTKALSATRGHSGVSPIASPTASIKLQKMWSATSEREGFD